MPADAFYLDQSVDYLGFLNAKLRDLRGITTLINELVQNADDASNARAFSLDITDDALIVENDGMFEDCGSVEAKDCKWGERRCDFHAFRNVASGHKRLEQNTTGAFGIGFISVYQVTDAPVLESGAWTWELDPGEVETRRIKATHREASLDATRFTLPWAFAESRIRARLGQSPVTRQDLSELPKVAADALRGAAPFLRRLQSLEIRRSGKVLTRITRDEYPASDDLVVDIGDSAQFWRRLKGSFEEEAAEMRSRYGSKIEDKRSAEVIVLVPHGDVPVDGLLYAFLPTEHRIAIPVLINADFFPSSNRKEIIFGEDYQGEWNAAAIRAAARAFAQGIPELRDLLKPSDLWRMFASTQMLQREAVSAKVPAPFSAFWMEAEPAIRATPTAYTSTGKWELPIITRLLQKPDEENEALPALEGLELPIAHRDLREYWNTMVAVGARELTAEDVIQAMRDKGFVGILEIDKSPAWLRSPAERNNLVTELLTLTARTPQAKRPQIEMAVRALPLCQTSGGSLAPISVTRLPDSEAQSLFGDIPGIYWLDLALSAPIVGIVKAFSTIDVEGWLRKQQELTTAKPDLEHARQVVSWILASATQWIGNPSFHQLLRDAPIWPSGEELKSLNELFVPGGFADPLSLADLVDGEVVAKWRRELTDTLGTRVLELETYLSLFVPKLFSAQEAVSQEIRRKLIGLIIDHIGDLQDRGDIAHALGQCPIVECRDGRFRCGYDTYFDEPLVRTILGNDSPLAVPDPRRPEAQHSALTWLGVASRPRAAAIVARVKEIASHQLAADFRLLIERVFRGLSVEWDYYSHTDALDDLRSLAWLPASGLQEWHRPASIFAVFRAQVFATVGPFLDVSRDLQTSPNGAKLLDYLGVRSEPSVMMVVRHLKNLVAVGRQPHSDVYRFLAETKEPQLLLPLKKVACLWSGDRFHRPDKVFLEQHRFGTRRYTLDNDWLRYAPFLKALDVKTTPDPADARAVLLEISNDYPSHLPISEVDYQVVFSCWQIISDHLAQLADDWFQDLATLYVIPNAARSLTRPDWLFFRDRPRLAEPFGTLLANNVIDRPSGSALAMSKAGVLPLSSAVEIDLVECDDPIRATDIEAVLQQRLPLVLRVLESSAQSQLSNEVFVTPSVFWANRLDVLYRVLLGGRSYSSPEPTSVTAYLERGTGRLYISRETRGWQTEVSRELAFAAIPDSSAAHLAAVVEIILVAGSVSEAAVRLDDLGFAPADVHIDLPEPTAALDAPQETAPVEADTGVIPSIEGGSEPQGVAFPNTGTASIAFSNSRGGLERTQGTGSHPKQESPAGNGNSRSTGGALRSYVVVQNSSASAKPISDEAAVRRAEVDDAGIACVMQHELTLGRTPKKMDHLNEGFDIESYDATGLIDRLIEVKSLSGKWSGFGVGMSAPQFRCAQDKGDQFWLYVVEFAGQSAERVYCIQNPARRIDEFRFDDGWEDAAERPADVAVRSILDIPNPERSRDLQS